MASILIVDDEQDNLDALQRLLRKEYEITATASALEALKKIQNEEYAIILSDQRMPEMTGVDLFEKAGQVSPNSTRILLTGYTDIEAVISAINRGHIYQYVAKPWDPADLRVTLKQGVDAYNMRKEIAEKNRALTKSNSQLKIALEELRKLDQAKARFLSLVSHELNTPITILSSFIGLLDQQKEALPKDLQASVSSLSEASGRLSEIVNEVLLYVKLEAQGGVRAQSVDLAPIVEKLKEKLQDSLGEKKLKLETTLSENCKVFADPEKLPIALEQLTLNCIQRAEPNTEVRLSAESTPQETVLTFYSIGTPLSEDAFAPLETGTSQMHHQKNLGLGLAIARLIVQGHSGRIGLKNAKQTTLITLALPLS